MKAIIVNSCAGCPSFKASPSKRPEAFIPDVCTRLADTVMDSSQIHPDCPLTEVVEAPAIESRQGRPCKVVSKEAMEAWWLHHMVRKEGLGGPRRLEAWLRQVRTFPDECFRVLKGRYREFRYEAIQK